MTHSVASYRKWKLLWNPKRLKLRALSLSWLSSSKRPKRGSPTKTRSSKICGMYVIDVSIIQLLPCSYYLLLCLFFSKNHARQLESLQASLETEVKSKSDLVGISRMPALLGKTNVRNSCRRRFVERGLYTGIRVSVSFMVRSVSWDRKWAPSLSPLRHICLLYANIVMIWY